jgi:hypothetical protein
MLGLPENSGSGFFYQLEVLAASGYRTTNFSGGLMSEEMQEQEPLLVEAEPEIGELVAALALAQLEFQTVKKDTSNPYYNSKYADLADIIAATQPALAKHGLVVIQLPKVDIERQSATLVSILAHKSGQSIRSSMTFPAIMVGRDSKPRFDAQSCGSAITYLRRYAYQPLVGVTAETDDDGNKAVGIGSKEAAQAVAQEKIAQLQSKKTNGHAIPPASIPKDEKDTVALLQASLDMQKEKKNGGINYPPIPGPEPPKPRTDRGADVDDVVGTIESIKDLKTKQGRAYKSVIIKDLFGAVLELSAFDDFQLSDGRLFQYLVPGALDQEATFTYVTKEKGGKQYHNIVNVSRIGSHRWDDGVGVLDANR